MKKTTLYIVGGLAALGLFYFLRGKAAKRLQVTFKDIQLGEIKGLKIPDIFARFRIINPTSTPLSVTAIAGQIYLNGNLFTTISNLEKTNIPGNTETIYSVKVLPPGISAFYAIYNLIKKRQDADIEFRGTINTTGFALPINESVTLKLWK
jgi:LEA14-like dessication related protein